MTVAATDTLDALATKYNVSQDAIMTLNQLTDPTLVVGQVLILPGAKGAHPDRRAQARAQGVVRPRTTVAHHDPDAGWRRASAAATRVAASCGRSWAATTTSASTTTTATGRSTSLPTYGTKVVAAAGGKVIFSGWKSNGGGWQVWISHGSNFFTTYNHMSAITVGTGEYVSRGQQVGRIGQSGDATGPHLHFETWIGPVWNGGQRMNPLNYL